MKKRVLLMILDGWGIAKNKSVSAIDAANTPFVDGLYKKYAHSKLEASGLAVGLPNGQMGNSEVGHMNIGAGRVVYQDLVKINKAVEDGSIAQNKEIKAAFDFAKQHNKNVHFIGLVSDGGVHSHINHLKGLCTAAHQQGLSNVFVHAFTDGRDTDPKSGLGFLTNLEEYMNKSTGKMATITGRYFAMDRDNRWERIKLAYDAMAKGVGTVTQNWKEAVQNSYNQEVTDEFIQPIIVDGAESIKAGDVVINFNFRTDRGREITQALTQKDFPEQEMHKLDLYYLTITNYDNSFVGVKVAYDKDNLQNTLGEVLSKNNLKQIRIAETEKYPHVTFFFSGGEEAPFKGESRLLCPSPKVATYDLQPEMSAADISAKIIPELKAKSADFICLNFANPDMVGHTGVFEAAVKACETVDAEANKVVTAALASNYDIIIIADHGNPDIMVNPDGSPNTAHTTNLVPCILASNTSTYAIKDGKLGDLAPTILTIMGVDIPNEMTGEILVS
ncbi:MAG: 2,3-bisphosphoglycerate-independent phosphoglycerate mutase [Cyclobacteriaceae bacterium]|nr:2,3-bisphosphoglycerate-independent phosphoglycerate mutase [Cyclobacteriaceae bacterium]